LKVCAVKTPGFGDEKKEILEDLAAITGATVITEEKGLKLEEATLDLLGKARRVEVDKEKTTIVEGKGSKAEIEKRKELIRAQIEATDSDYKKKDLEKRLAKLGGGVAVIKVGAATETEMKEKKMRIDDALHATKAAVEEGVIPGGGVTLFRAKSALKDLRVEGDEEVAITIVERALEEPLRQIAVNAGREGAEVVSRIASEKSEAVGYNAKKDEYEDLLRAGVIDPTKVVRSALQNAASIAGMVLTTEAIVTDFDEEKDEKTSAIII